MTQKEIKEKYMDIMRTEVWPNSPDMQKYADKKFYYGVELDNGDLYVIEKPVIQKDFCFGYGMYGRSDEEDEVRASDMAHKAKTNEEYFIDQNMEEFNDRIECLKDTRRTGYKYLAYCGQEEDSKLKACTMIKPYDFNRIDDRAALEELSQKEIDALIAGYEEAKKMFEKRLKTYLKRYGLSKLNVWTYLRD